MGFVPNWARYLEACGVDYLNFDILSSGRTPYGAVRADFPGLPGG